jgi:hypothetical protein
MNNKDVSQFVETLSQPSSVECKRTPDMRASRCRKLRKVSHESHFLDGWVKTNKKYPGRKREFTSLIFESACQTLSDQQFDNLVTALAVIKKMN